MVLISVNDGDSANGIGMLLADFYLASLLRRFQRRKKNSTQSKVIKKSKKIKKWQWVTVTLSCDAEDVGLSEFSDHSS